MSRDVSCHKRTWKGNVAGIHSEKSYSWRKDTDRAKWKSTESRHLFNSGEPKKSKRIIINHPPSTKRYITLATLTSGNPSLLGRRPHLVMNIAAGLITKHASTRTCTPLRCLKAATTLPAGSFIHPGNNGLPETEVQSADTITSLWLLIKSVARQFRCTEPITL